TRCLRGFPAPAPAPAAAGSCAPGGSAQTSRSPSGLVALPDLLCSADGIRFELGPPLVTPLEVINVDPIHALEGTEPASAPPAAPAPTPETEASARTCPKCRGTLWVVVGSRWCSNCGYRQLTNDAPEPDPDAVSPNRQAARPRGGEWSEIRRLIPAW